MIDEAIAEVVNSTPDKETLITADLFQLQLDGEVYDDVKAELYADCIILRVKVHTNRLRNSWKMPSSRSPLTLTSSSSCCAEGRTARM